VTDKGKSLILPNKYEITAALYLEVMYSGFQSLGWNITPLSFNNNCSFGLNFTDCSFLPNSLSIVEYCPKQTKQSTWNFSSVICLPFCKWGRSCGKKAVLLFKTLTREEGSVRTDNSVEEIDNRVFKPTNKSSPFICPT
jgi:hypothetical protein